MDGSSWLHIGPNLLAVEPSVRWYLYLIGLGLMLAWETLWPRKRLVSDTAWRWAGQLILMVVASVITLWAIPVGAIEVAIRAASSGWGLLPHSGLPYWAQCLIGVLVLDLVRFGQHWCYHSSPLLWRLHRIHHSDPDFDLTTGLRVHPVEMMLSLATYLPVIWLCGVPVFSVVTYESMHLVHSFFAHANIVLPQRLDGFLRLFLVTPETHRIHHSDRMEENMRNFGEIFTVWDRLLGTHQEQPADGHEAMGIGLRGHSGQAMWNPIRLLIWPFYDKAITPSAPVAKRLDVAEERG